MVTRRKGGEEEGISPSPPIGGTEGGPSLRALRSPSGLEAAVKIGQCPE